MVPLPLYINVVINDAEKGTKDRNTLSRRAVDTDRGNSSYALKFFKVVKSKKRGRKK